MHASGLRQHLDAPSRRGHHPARAHTGAAGGAACRDLVRVSVELDADHVADAGFDASGCGATIAAGSAAVTLVNGRPLLEASRIGPQEIAAELGGLIAAKRHAAELAADALHRALGSAARTQACLPAVAGRTLVAMSGGVDSAVAALLCARDGGDVAAVTLELWADRDNDAERSCCSASAVRGARALAQRMGIAHLTLDLREEFRAGVVDPFIAGHEAGETPNPCVRCNGHVRLDAMLALADRLGAEALVTGHYARVADGERPVLRVAADPAKDQSYMLAALRPETLRRMRFPLGDLHKPQVRAVAAEAGLPVAFRPDSQDLCFLAGTDRPSFLARHAAVQPRAGELVDADGTLLGRHGGHQGFTVGQRRGIRLGGRDPLYVLAKDARSNRVVVGPREALERSRVVVRGVTLHRPAREVDRVRLRYHSQTLPCRVAGAPAAGRHRRLELELGEPTDAVAPGQTACLMAGELVVGHATIAPA